VVLLGKRVIGALYLLFSGQFLQAQNGWIGRGVLWALKEVTVVKRTLVNSFIG
jgi:hypothetical protein